MLVGITSGLITAGVMFLVNRIMRWRDWRRDHMPEVEQYEPQHWASGSGRRAPTYQTTLWPLANVDFVVRSVRVKQPRRAAFQVRSAHAHRPALNQWRNQADSQGLEDCLLRSRDLSPLTIGVTFEGYATHPRVDIRLSILQKPRVGAGAKIHVIRIVYEKA